MKKIRHGLKKMLLMKWYKKYVRSNETIQEDILQTFIQRGCKSKRDSVESKFQHLMFYYPEFAFIFFWRIKRQTDYWTRLFSQPYQCKVFRSTKINGGLMCYHPFATVINAKSIGKNFQFRNGLTIGNKNNDNTKLPVIGDDVTVGANVVIIGDINIGNNVIIGAGSVVVKDIPSNVVFAGNPAKLIRSLT